MSKYLQKSKQYKGFHYTVINPESLDYLHQRTFEMFKQVKMIFDKNDIKYMICGGTLLGACPEGEANGNFIPWDDDFDVCIFEEDYKKATDLLIEQLDSSMILHCSETDPHYYHGWMKVRDRNSHVYPDDPILSENGVWIDLYKLVKVKTAEIKYICVKEHLDYLKRRLNVGGISKQEFDKRVNENNLIERIFFEKENICNDDNSYSYLILSASKISLKEEWVLPLKKLSFEGEELTTFNKYEEYLLTHYGENYKTFPKVELRRIGINRIDIMTEDKK